MSCILPLRTWPGSKWASISMLWMYMRRSRYVRLFGVPCPWWSAHAVRDELARAKPAPAARCRNSRLVGMPYLGTCDEGISESSGFFREEDFFILNLWAPCGEPSLVKIIKVGPLYHSAAKSVKNILLPSQRRLALPCWLPIKRQARQGIVVGHSERRRFFRLTDEPSGRLLAVRFESQSRASFRLKFRQARRIPERGRTEMAIATVNPATGQLMKSFEPLSDAEIEVKLQKAADTFSRYRHVPFAERARMMMKAADIIDHDKEQFARMMTTEMGKTLRSAVDEAVKCAWVCRYYAENAERFLADEIVETTASRSYIRYQPLGAVLAVMPWNFPFWQVLRFAAPALMAGNVGLLKHASIVPQCALMIEDLFRRAGFPDGSFQTLLIGSQKVERILDDSRVMAATLTGSEGAGVQVGMDAAKGIKKVVLELGGSDPFIIMPSANLEVAVTTAVKARIFNNGQSCIAAKRFIVAEKIADEFERKFVSKMEALKVGD